MNATCIVGSARSTGSTAYLTDTLIKGMREAGVETKKYNIGECRIGYCAGCKRCYADGRCFQDDDVYPIVQDLLRSDFVSIAAPSYWADVPGQLKTFFDRCTPFGDTNEKRILRAEKPIRGIAIAVRAGVRKEENELILNAITHFYGHLGIETAHRISVCETDTLEDLLSKHRDVIDEVYALGRRLGGL